MATAGDQEEAEENLRDILHYVLGAENYAALIFRSVARADVLADNAFDLDDEMEGWMEQDFSEAKEAIHAYLRGRDSDYLDGYARAERVAALHLLRSARYWWCRLEGRNPSTGEYDDDHPEPEPADEPEAT